MKRKNFRLSIVLIVFALVGVMFASAACASVNNVNDSANSANSAVTVTESGKKTSDLVDQSKVPEQTVSYKADDEVGIIVQMDESTLLDTYLASPDKYDSYQDFLTSYEGKKAAQNLKDKQNALFNKIARKTDAKLACNYVNVLNGFAVTIKYGERKSLADVAYGYGAVNAMISDHYDEPQVDVVTNQVNAQTTGIFDSTSSKEKGYWGEGMVVAVLDTGLDYEHPAFDPENEIFAKDNVYKLDEAKIEALLPYLAASKLVDNLTWRDVYYNKKVPFGFDYTDHNGQQGDTNISTHVDNEHGTHVAGIIAGHSEHPYDIDEDGNEVPRYDDLEHKEITGITGVAPKAQLAIYKVFSDYKSGAESHWLLAALEDTVVVGVDVINMSLGSNSGFQDDINSKDSIYDAYENVGKAGISLVVAASNAYSSGFSSHYGLNLISNPDSATVGSPSTYDSALSVASISGVKSKYISAYTDANNVGKEPVGIAYYQEAAHVNSQSYDFISDLRNAVKSKNLMTQYVRNWSDLVANGTQDDMEKWELSIPYKVIPGLGKDTDYTDDVTNKIVLVARGSISFEDKLKIARNHGALACIVFNNVSGVIRMQVGDEVNIPACSIMMDAAVAFRRNGSGYIVVDQAGIDGAGPFMSDFSSWGPLPNLRLKPEITAHGGEIYSAIPGDKFAYARLSGTSMACPNMAGVVALMRQYMQAKDSNGNYLYAQKYGILNEAGNAIDNNKMEARIYQLLMSTTTIANNEEGNPYSPRKQGSGLADLSRAQSTEQYAVVYTDEEGVTSSFGVREDGRVETERTKLELLDDPEKTGVYTLDFVVRNVASGEVTYRPNIIVMTEGISTDGKTVTEKAHVLDNCGMTLKVNGADMGAITSSTTVTVPANGEVEVVITVTLGAKDRAWLEQFSNGMYVEGFVTMDNVDANGIDLNVPYLAFYGDWADAPIFDYDIYETSKDEHDDNIDDEDKRYSGNKWPTQLFGKYMENGDESIFNMGSWIFYTPDEYKAPDSTEDKCAIGYNENGGIMGLYAVSGFLRGMKKVFYTITDEITGEVIYENVYYAARKAGGAAGIGGMFIELDTKDLNVVNNAKYRITIYGVLDWNADKITSKDQVSEENTWSSAFWIDTDSPFISNTEVRIERDSRDNATYYLDLYVTDNHYAAGMSFDYYNKKDKDFATTFSDKGLRPFETMRNATTCVTFNITDYWEQIHDAIVYRLSNENAATENPEEAVYPAQFRTMIYDYAMNHATYTIDMYELLKNYVHQEIQFGDVGNYSVKGNDKVIMSATDKVKTDANGEYVLLPEENEVAYSMIIGQKVELMKSVIATPANSWREDLKFSIVSGADCGKIDAETGEFISTAAGLVKIRVQSVLNPEAYDTITINVLTEEKVAEYKLNKKQLLAKSSIEELTLVEAGQYLNAGEWYLVEVEVNPWYIDTSAYNIVWKSGTTTIATVMPYYEGVGAYYNEAELTDEQKAKLNPYKQWVIANSSRYVNGEYKTNTAGAAVITATVQEKDSKGNWNNTFYTAQFTAIVQKEFVTSGDELTEYHGIARDKDDDGNVVEGLVRIPDNLSIKKTARVLFYKKAGIKKIILPEKLTNVGYASFAYMPDLEEVVLPSTVVTIDGYAFAAYYNSSMSLPDTKLQVVDFSKCAKPIYIGKMAFGMQVFLGADLEATGDIFRDDFKISDVVLRDDFDQKFDLKMVRGAEILAFYGLYCAHGNINLENLRAANTNSFAGFGYWAGRGTDLSGIGADVVVRFGKYTVLDGAGIFAGSSITEMIFDGTPRISSALFGGNSANLTLRKVTFTADNLVIESYAFSGCIMLGNIEFKGSVASIGDYAFMQVGVASIKYELVQTIFGPIPKMEGDLKVTFDSTCKRIGSYAFARSAIKEITLPAGLEKLESYSFLACEDLAKVTIAKDCNLETVDGIGLKGAPFVMSDNISEYIVETGHEKFMSKGGAIFTKDGKTIIAVPSNCATDPATLLDGVEEIGDYAFAYAYGVEGEEGKDVSVNIVIPETVKKIGVGAFLYSTNLKSVVLPTTITEIPDVAFANCENLVSVDFNGNSAITSIGAAAFVNSAIEEITLPRDLTSIGVQAFSGCTKLTSVAFPRGITEVPVQAFANCTSLRTVFFNKVETIGAQAFAYSGITEIGGTDSSADKVKSIGYGAFIATTNLASVNLPAVETIAEFAFGTATDDKGNTYSPVITSLSIPNVKSIGKAAFAYQSGITQILIPKCEYIGIAAFMGCSGIESLNISSAKTIEQYAFYGNKFAFAPIYKNVENLSPLAFLSDTVRNYAMENGNQRYFVDNGAIYAYNYTTVVDEATGESSVVYDHDSYTLVSVPTAYQAREFEVLDGTVRIGEYAFAYNQYIYKVTIPASVKAIGAMAFYNSEVVTYNFLGMNAPELETESMTWTSDSSDAYYWQVYGNFGLVFNFTMGQYGNFFKYNSIRLTSQDDVVYLTQDYKQYHPIYNIKPEYIDQLFHVQNESYTGGGFTNAVFGITMVHASNAIGFDNFIYANYFDSEILTAELLEDNTSIVIDLIRALPEAKDVTLSDARSIEYARAKFDAIGSHNQKQFVADANMEKKLTYCERALNQLKDNGSQADPKVAEVQTLIDAIAENMLNPDKEAVAAARAAYNELTDEQKAKIVRLSVLEAAEKTIKDNEDNKNNDSSSCGTVTFGFGGGNGFGGIMMMAFAVIVVAAVVLAKRKNSAK